MDLAQLTRKQKQFFDFILSYREEHEVWPTYREIADHFDYKSPNSVTQNIQALLKKGVLVRGDQDEYDLHPSYRKTKIDRTLYQEQGIPIKGLIAAGYLQEAVESELGSITLDTIFPHLDKMFALRVSGMSMKDAGIFDGDFVLLMDSDIKDGDIGAVLYNGETSLKKIYHDQSGLRLEPANEEYSHITISPDIFEEVRILGKYIGHVNRSGIYRSVPAKKAS
ncbi:MAG: transcriptional repressor LexA [Balneolaceae bacterium]